MEVEVSRGEHEMTELKQLHLNVRSTELLRIRQTRGFVCTMLISWCTETR